MSPIKSLSGSFDEPSDRPPTARNDERQISFASEEADLSPFATPRSGEYIEFKLKFRGCGSAALASHSQGPKFKIQIGHRGSGIVGELLMR